MRRVPPTRRGAALLLAASLFAPLFALSARADDAVTGFGACRDLEARNDRELALWTSTRPPTPYAYPAREAILDAPWIELGRALGHSAALLAATAAPHVGVGFRTSSPEFVITWPLSASVGPALACTRKAGTFDVDRSRPNRFLLEPSLWIGDAGTTFALRPGYRFLVHPADWLFGFGAGLGVPIEIVRPQKLAPRAGLGPELVVQFGGCCAPGYFNLTTRLEIYFDGAPKPPPVISATPVAFSVTLGFTYF